MTNDSLVLIVNTTAYGRSKKYKLGDTSGATLATTPTSARIRRRMADTAAARMVAEAARSKLRGSSKGKRKRAAVRLR